MLFDELEELERVEQPDHREIRRLIPIDAESQLGTGYTGRPLDTADPEKRPMSHEEKTWRRRR